jgi:hypothetical protein
MGRPLLTRAGLPGSFEAEAQRGAKNGEREKALPPREAAVEAPGLVYWYFRIQMSST